MEDDLLDDLNDHGPWFPARYDGYCDGCGDWFGAGELIRINRDGDYIAQDGCEETSNRAPLPPTCPECFTVTSVTGQCDCTG